MPVVAIMNYKGGVGKTTITANFAAELARRGRKILLIDIDSQASLTFSFYPAHYWRSHLAQSLTIRQWFESIVEGHPIALSTLRTRPHVVEQRLRELGSGGCLHVIASHLDLIDVDIQLASLLSSTNLNLMRRNYIRVYSMLARELQGMIKFYDLILIDCPPNFNLVTRSALVASDRILIPTRPDYLSTFGIDYLRGSVRTLAKEYNDTANVVGGAQPMSPRYLGIVFNMVEIHNQTRQPIQIQAQYMAEVHRSNSDIAPLQRYIRLNNNSFADVARLGVPLVLDGQATPVGQAIAEDIRKLTDEIVARL